MAEVKQVVVSAAEFASTVFWKRAAATAAEQGHDGHPTMLAGEADPADVYRLRCLLCDTTIIEITVDRSDAGTMEV